MNELIELLVEFIVDLNCMATCCGASHGCVDQCWIVVEDSFEVVVRVVLETVVVVVVVEKKRWR